MHDRERAQDKAQDPAAERAPAAAANVPAALALQRKIGNRAFGQLVARATPEESVEMIEPVITSAHADVDQISRTFLPFSKDQEGFDKMADAYEKKTETPLKSAIESRFEGEDLLEINKRVPWRGYPVPESEGGGAA